jgi:hypothetical protein
MNSVHFISLIYECKQGFSHGFSKAGKILMRIPRKSEHLRCTPVQVWREVFIEFRMRGKQARKKQNDV